MSGAAEGIAGLALSAVSVASLFTTCIDCYNLVVAARDFGHDYELLCIQLELQKLRFFLWGESVGLATREPDVQPRPNPGLYDPFIQPVLIRTLGAIKNLLSETQEFDERYGFRSEQSIQESGSRGLSIFRATFDQFRSQARRNQKQKSIGTVTRWAIFDADHFESKIAHLKGFFDALESVTRSLVTPEAQRDRLRQEIESISDVDSLRLLRDAAGPDIEDLSDTASRRLTFIESSDANEVMSLITRTESSVTSQTFFTARSHFSNENRVSEDSTSTSVNLYSADDTPPRAPAPASVNSVPGRFKFQHRSNSILRRITSPTTTGAILPSPPMSISTPSTTPNPTRVHSAVGKMVLYKLVVLGDGGVGKTALTIQVSITFKSLRSLYINTQQLSLNHFVETHDPTIEDSYRKKVVIDGQACMLEVLDTAGQEEYTALRNLWIRDGEGFVIVYSIYSRASFIRCGRFYNQIRRVKEISPFSYGELSTALQGIENDCSPVMLVGHDYVENEEAESRGTLERRVSSEEGSALTRELGCEYVEACAETRMNVEKAFYNIVRELRKQRAVASNRPRAMPAISEKKLFLFH
jgi:GTPase KRas protein